MPGSSKSALRLVCGWSVLCLPLLYMPLAHPRQGCLHGRLQPRAAPVVSAALPPFVEHGSSNPKVVHGHAYDGDDGFADDMTTCWLLKLIATVLWWAR